MLFMTRGCGVEANEGLLIVPKLDYLQLLVVERVRDAAAAAGRAAARAARGLVGGESSSSEDAPTLISSDSGDEACAATCAGSGPACVYAGGPFL